MQDLLDRSTDIEPDGCSNDALAGFMCDDAVAIAARQRRLLRVVRVFDSRRAWERDGCRTMAQWLAGHFDISVSEGTRWTEAAHALERLPQIAAAFERGAIGLDKVLQLARFATPDTERELLAYARRASLNALRREADLANRPPLDEHTDNHHARFLEWRTINDAGAIYLEALFPAEEGAIVTRTLQQIADKLPEMPALEQKVEPAEVPDWFGGDHDALSADTVVLQDGHPQRLADAMVALASNQFSTESDRGRPTVVVSTTLAALQSQDAGCEIEGSGVVHPEIARRIACDCRLQIVLRDANGNAVGIGRESRVVPGYMRRELMHRDGGCTFPGCGARRYLDAHHIIHWEHGGRTDMDNLTLVCHFHHKLLHEHRWMVELDADQRATWFRPDRTRYDPSPALAA